MERNIIILVIAIFIISIGVFVSILFINSRIVIDAIEVPATLTLGDKAGFDTNNSMLTFGAITKDTSLTRTVTVQNSNNVSLRLEISVEGDISEFVKFDEIIVLEPGENKSVQISAVGNNESGYGNYSGIVTFVFKRDLFN